MGDYEEIKTQSQASRGWSVSIARKLADFHQRVTRQWLIDCGYQDRGNDVFRLTFPRDCDTELFVQVVFHGTRESVEIGNRWDEPSEELSQVAVCITLPARPLQRLDVLIIHEMLTLHNTG